jgi:acyl dehydratase
MDADWIREYAAATKDPVRAVQAGEVVPAVAVVTQIWDAQNAGREALVDRQMQANATGGVHGEHDVVLHRPILPGEPLQTWVEGQGARPAGRNVLVTLRYSTYDDSETLVAEQWWTTVFLNTTCQAVGDAAPDHTLAEETRERPAGAYHVLVDDGMARRYAEVSHDWSAHHFDLAAANHSGFDRLFLHGLCTMALCAHGVVTTVTGSDPERVRRVAVRFASPTFLGDQLDLRLFEVGPLSYAFEAESAGKRVIANGLAELRP